VIRGSEAGKRGARWHKVTFALDFLTLKGLRELIIAELIFTDEGSRVCRVNFCGFDVLRRFFGIYFCGSVIYYFAE